ncbi:MAG: DUF2625 family protein [Lachnospiraceae bacterium]|nr:DUF2625 family protein [Lachnospiraceae bacterium]
MDNIWKKLQDLFCKSNYDIIIYDGVKEIGKNECDKLNIPYDSALASVVMNCSGIIVDNWIKILGHGNENRNGVLHHNSIAKSSYLDGMFIVATDIVGGIYAINISRFHVDKSVIWYFAPDTLEWESMSMKYIDFIAWTLTGNINDFYESMRWNNWREECKNMEYNTCKLIYPFLWSKECDINSATKRNVIFDELMNLNFDYAEKIQ